MSDFDVVAEGQNQRDQFSKAASENARKLDFLGFGLIALFGGLKQSDFNFPADLPNNLVWAGLLLVLALAADLLQYVYGAIAFAIFARTQENKPKSKRRVDFPPQINWPTNFFFVGKLGLTVAAWIVLLVHLAKNVS